MREKNKCFRYINFTPYKLKVFKSENFALKGTPILNRHKTSNSYLNNNNNNNRGNNHLLIKNPTQNYLFDKININNLSTSKILLNKSINNSKSVDCNQNDTIKKEKSKNIIFYKNNSLKNLYCNNNYNLNYKNRTPIKNKTTNNNDVIIPPDLYNLNDNYKIKNANPKIIYLESNKYKFRNRDIGRLQEKLRYNYKLYNDDKKKEKIKKIILIQSFWRSYFLRKLVVGGLEKYYSSIAMSKYLINIFYKNKQKLFSYFIEVLKEYIIKKKYSCFKYRKNNNNINIFFKGNEESIGSFEIPNDKKNDCIYFFIKREQDKTNKNKIINDKNKNNFKKENNINIKHYNYKYNKRSRNTKNNMITLYNKKSNDNINKDNYKNNINIKINLINHNNNDNSNSHRKTTNNNYSKIFDKNKINLNCNLNKIKHKKVYVKKKVGEENNNYNHHNKLLKKNSASFKKDKTDEINTKKEIYKNHINSFINMIKRKFIHLNYRLFIYNLKIKIKNNNKEKHIYISKLFKILNKIIIKKYFNMINNNNNDKNSDNIFEFIGNKKVQLYSFFPIRNITYYKKKNNKHNYAKLNKKPNLENQYQKIKVNKNNAIEKNKKSKLLKKIIEKKTNKENILKKYYLIWKQSYKLVYIDFNSNRNYKIENEEKRNRNKSESNKKHIKIKFKKTFTNNTIRSSSYEKSNLLSVSSKKMKVSKKIYDKNNFYSTASSSNLPNYKNNIFNRISNDENQLYNKVISIIKKIENKNIIYKYFIDWKKEVKKK